MVKVIYWAVMILTLLWIPELTGKILDDVEINNYGILILGALLMLGDRAVVTACK